MPRKYEKVQKMLPEVQRLNAEGYIYFYNNQRIQTKTKLTPLELRCQCVNSYFPAYGGFFVLSVYSGAVHSAPEFFCLMKSYSQQKASYYNNIRAVKHAVYRKLPDAHNFIIAADNIPVQQKYGGS